MNKKGIVGNIILGILVVFALGIIFFSLHKYFRSDIIQPEKAEEFCKDNGYVSFVEENYFQIFCINENNTATRIIHCGDTFCFVKGGEE